MTAAIYVRKSALADDLKSVARQIEHARFYAERKAWSPNLLRMARGEL